MKLTADQEERVITFAMKLARGMYSPDMGGCPSLKLDGTWQFVGTCPEINPADVDLMFEIADLRHLRRPVHPLGSCSTCRHAIDGRERGWSYAPCVSCSQPLMSNWEGR